MSDKIRLLICATCPSIEELPAFDGPPEYDEWLTRALTKHKTANGTPHIGLPIANVKSSEWSDPTTRKAIIEKIYGHAAMPGRAEGMGSEYYDTKSNFLQDAMTCWKGFNRTTDPGHCDYRKDNKRLYPGTGADRKELGLDPKDRPNTFLCDFCPVHSIVLQKEREKAGQYK